MPDITHIGQLHPDPHNARKHNPRNVQTIVNALHEVGAARSIVIDEHNTVLAGNGVIEGAAQAGIERVRVIDADGEEIIAVRRRGLTDEQKTRLALYDNRASELAEWDVDVLSSLSETDALDGLFTGDEIDVLLASLDKPTGAGGDEFDTTPDDAQTRVQYGDLWLLGDHRLLCGDSTKSEDVQRLMGGERAQVLLTDPPYSSGGFQEAGKSTGSIGTRSTQKIAADNLSTRGYRLLINDVLALATFADSLYLFTDWRMWIETFDAAERGGWRMRNMLVWDKEQMGMGFPWRSQHELIAFAKRTPAQMMGGKRGNVLQAQRTGNVNHPTEKPVTLLTDILSNSEAGSVYDPFLGSGTTLIAAERLGRKCYGLEIEPKYCDVILRRWEAETGREAVRVDG